MPLISLVQGDEDLEQILELQRQNRAVTDDGFVTVEHSMTLLREMHALMPSVVAKVDGAVVGYALAMSPAVRLPILEPMFARIEGVGRYYVMGQICIAKAHRGSGLFDALYAEHARRYGADYDCVVTEVATRNGRSRRAHERVGFRTLTTYRDETDEWALIAWDLRPVDLREG